MYNTNAAAAAAAAQLCITRWAFSHLLCQSCVRPEFIGLHTCCLSNTT
jgi:hypothetical protein